MSVLLISNTIINDLKKLRLFAEQNIVTVTPLNQKTLKPVGDNPDFVVRIPPDTKVVFSIERQPEGTVAHLSVSTNYKIPPVHLVNEILPHLGFPEFPETPVLHIEGEGGTDWKAINIWLEYEEE